MRYTKDKIKDIVTDGYLNILKRHPDNSGMETYVTLLERGMTVDNFHKILKSSNEYKNINTNASIDITFEQYKLLTSPCNKTDKITIICPTYNNLEYVSLFYESFILSKKISREIDIIISINGDDIQTEEFCIKNNIKHITNKKLGMYSAINNAVKQVSDGYLMIINDDIYLDELFFISLESWLSENVVMISKSIQPDVSDRTFKDCKDFGIDFIKFDKEKFLNYCKEIKSHNASFHNFGVVYLIHTKNWFVINGFDERFDPYGGGMADLMYRLYLSGIKNFWLLNNVLHYHFMRKCAIKHSLSPGDVPLNLFTEKWKKDFSEVDKIIREVNTKNL